MDDSGPGIWTFPIVLVLVLTFLPGSIPAVGGKEIDTRSEGGRIMLSLDRTEAYVDVAPGQSGIAVITGNVTYDGELEGEEDIVVRFHYSIAGATVVGTSMVMISDDQYKNPFKCNVRVALMTSSNANLTLDINLTWKDPTDHSSASLNKSVPIRVNPYILFSLGSDNAFYRATDGEPEVYRIKIVNEGNCRINVNLSAIPNPDVRVEFLDNTSISVGENKEREIRLRIAPLKNEQASYVVMISAKCNESDVEEIYTLYYKSDYSADYIIHTFVTPAAVCLFVIVMVAAIVAITAYTIHKIKD